MRLYKSILRQLMEDNSACKYACFFARKYSGQSDSFIESSSRIVKFQPWKGSTKAIKKKYAKLNNNVLPKIAKASK